MNDRDETDKTSNQPDQPEDSPGLIAWLKQLYADRPGLFAVGLICVSVMVFILGGVVSGGIDLG